MRIYIAARFTRKADAKRLATQLELEGHEITLKWWELDVQDQWKDQKSTLGARLASTEREHIYIADALVLLWSPDILGAAIEAGMAMAEQIPVFVVGAERECVFWYLPEVTLVEDKKELLRIISEYE